MTALIILGLILLVILGTSDILGTEDIGTGQTYTTIQEWEDDIPADITADQIYTGQCLGEALARVDFIGHTTDATHYYQLISKDGAEHDGRAHDVSAAGNARIEYAGASSVILISDEYTRIAWMEVSGPGNNTSKSIVDTGIAACTLYIHHNILHNDHANNAPDQEAIRCGDVDPVWLLYRNIVYGTGGRGLYLYRGAENSAVLCNTVYECNFSEYGTTGGIGTSDTDFLIENNACFDNPVADIKGTAGTLDYNATSDTTGDDEGANGIADLVTADQFVNPTTTWANTDLLPKVGHGMTPGDTFSTATYPEIDESIDNRGVSITGAWDIGAGQYVGGAPPSTVIPVFMRSHRQHWS